MVKLIGFAAIEFAEQEGLTLNKAADSVDEAAAGLTVAEAEAIAAEDPDAIWLEVSDDDYYGEPKNMTPGAAVRPNRRTQNSYSQAGETRRRAGQRPDEFLPGENDPDVSPDSLRGDAAGSPVGGIAASGMAGSTRGSGTPSDDDTGDDPGDRLEDDLSDTVEGTHPQSGRSGGAVGGTPAGKRVTPVTVHGSVEKLVFASGGVHRVGLGHVA